MVPAGWHCPRERRRERREGAKSVWLAEAGGGGVAASRGRGLPAGVAVDQATDTATWPTTRLRLGVSDRRGDLQCHRDHGARPGRAAGPRPGRAAGPRPGRAAGPDPAEQPGPDTWVANLGSLPLLAHPGERWLYNTGASALGVLLARAAGVPFPEVLQTRVFGPLEMRDTAFFASDVGRLATLYVSTLEGNRVWDAHHGKWSRSPAFADGASGLVSTTDDLLAFARMFLRGGGPVLTPDQVREMTRDQLTGGHKGGHGGLFDGHSWAYCQSVVTEGPNKGAFGWDGGFGVSWLVDPSRDLVVIVLTQRITEHFPLRRELQAAAYSALP